MKHKTTNILCFMCKKRYGIECAGRKENESTMCDPCFQLRKQEAKTNQIEHRLNMLDDGEISVDLYMEWIDKY